ncbi:MAG: hypothetical protein CVV49_00640 [Spirochaetae bacterium HGW-Spirochaetae-5]|nr:MAG: hypothetical protein CVV49_00640 [Spirochaetae bacterium HGW-Spirochaetae-5]
MISFDIRTLSFLVMLSSLLLAIGLQIVNYVIKKDTSLRLWAIGETVIGIGMVLVWLRDFIPDYLSIVLSNTLLVTGIGFQYLGNLSFQGKKSTFPWYWCLSALTAILFIYFTYFMPNLSVRIVAYSIIATTLRFAIAYIVLRPKDGQDRLVHWFVAMGYIITAIFMVIRGVSNLFMGPTNQNLMAAGGMIQAIFFISEIGLRLVLAIGLPLLVFGRTHRLLIAGEQRYRTMIELSPAPMLVLYDDRICYVNPATIKMLGANSAQDLLSKSFLDFVNPDIHNSVLMRIQSALVTGETNPKVEEKLNKLDGTTIVADVQSTPILYSGQTAVQVIINDITDHKLKEEKIKSLLAEKENLLKEVHHRVKNNIASISSLLYLQAEDSTNAEVKSRLHTAISHVDSMCILYEKLLLGNDYQEVSVKNYIESLVDSIVGVFSDKKVTIEQRINDFDLEADKLVSIGMALNEILTNAFKYAFIGRDSGHILIHIDRIGNQVNLSVQDDGVGLKDGYDINKTSGFGSMILKVLSTSYSIESNNGTRSFLTFEINNIRTKLNVS